MDNSKEYKISKFRIRYTTDFKHQICREFLSGQYSKTELQDKYSIKGKSRLLSWLNELGYMEYIRENSIRMVKQKKPTKSIKKQEFQSLQLQSLETALQDARLQAEAYCKMIELAEKQYKIRIRKNLNTK